MIKQKNDIKLFEFRRGFQVIPCTGKNRNGWRILLKATRFSQLIRT